MESLADLKSMPITATQPGTEAGQLLTNLASVRRTSSSPIYSHYNVMPVIDVFGGVSGRDLAGVLDDINPLIAEAEKTLPHGSSIILRGQAQTMRASFIGLSVGLVMAIALIYLLLVVNFQSWLDPFIILTALTGAGRRRWGCPHRHHAQRAGDDGRDHVPRRARRTPCSSSPSPGRICGRPRRHPCRWEAGSTRLRPVLMTAAAMIIGMVPMALGLGDGGEQNAPLGRAVIGGLILATVATLFFVPSSSASCTPHRRRPASRSRSRNHCPHSPDSSTHHENFGNQTRTDRDQRRA